MYFLHLFGLGSQVPMNCQIFNKDFRCVKCIQGYVLMKNNGCVKYSVFDNTINNNINNNLNQGIINSGSTNSWSSSTISS
jgi:hypothetical protein